MEAETPSRMGLVWHALVDMKAGPPAETACMRPPSLVAEARRRLYAVGKVVVSTLVRRDAPAFVGTMVDMHHVTCMLASELHDARSLLVRPFPLVVVVALCTPFLPLYSSPYARSFVRRTGR